MVSESIPILNKRNCNLQTTGANTTKCVIQTTSMRLSERGMNDSTRCKMEMFGDQLYWIRLLLLAVAQSRGMKATVLWKKLSMERKQTSSKTFTKEARNLISENFAIIPTLFGRVHIPCLLYTSPSPRD